MTEPYPFPTSADEFADKRVLVTGGTRGIGAAEPPRPERTCRYCVHVYFLCIDPRSGERRKA